MKHTPWKVSNHKDETTHSYIVDHSNQYFIGTIIQKEDAEYIVQCVNSHEELMEALKKSHACATVRDDGLCDGCYVSEAIQKAESK